MHGTRQKSQPTSNAVTLIVREDKARGKMSEEIARDKDFLGRLERVLVEAGLPGSYHLDAYTMVKGSPHRQGFNVGSPRPNRYCIELIWQPRGNDECYSIALMVPRTHDLFAFHKKLDDAWQAITAREEAEAATPKKSKGVYGSDAPLWSPPALPSGEEFLRAVIKSATSTGVVSASACIDLLEASYKCVDPKQFLITMIGEGYFVNHNGSETFLRITQDWLDLLQGDHSAGNTCEASIPKAPGADIVILATPVEPVQAEQVPPPVVSAQLASAPVVAATAPPVLTLVPAAAPPEPVQLSTLTRPSGLAGQLAELKRLVKEARNNRERANELGRTIAAHDEVIESETRKRDLAREEHRKLLDAINDPGVVAAERELAEAEAALRS